MSNSERLTPPEDYVSELEAIQVRLQDNASEIAARKADSGAAWSEMSKLVGKFGVPEEVKFTVAAFSGFPTDPERSTEFVEYLRQIDEQIKAAASETVAWLTSEVEVTSTSFNPRIPPDTKERFTLHVGILPQDAKLVVAQHGKLLVPIERSVAFPLIAAYMNSEHPSLDDELFPVNQRVTGYETPGLEWNPELDLGSYSKEAPYPVVIGNSAVEELFDKHKLEVYNEVIEAIEALKSSIH